MTDLEARAACKTIIGIATTSLIEGKNALRKIKELVNGLSLDDEAPSSATRKYSGARDRLERSGANREGE